MKALEGIKVVDLTRVVSGPHCTMILGDFGADVIKIEKPGAGDIGRGYAPFYEGEATYFMTHNRNKRSGYKLFELLHCESRLITLCSIKTVH